MSSTVTGLPISTESRSAWASRMCRCASAITFGSPGYLHKRVTNSAAAPRLRPSLAPFFIRSAFSGWGGGFLRFTSLTQRSAGTRAAYTAARQATSGRRAHQRCSVEMCPLRTDFSREASLLMASMGR